MTNAAKDGSIPSTAAAASDQQGTLRLQQTMLLAFHLESQLHVVAASYWDLNRDNPHMYTSTDLFPDPRVIESILNHRDYEMLDPVYQGKINTLRALLAAFSSIPSGTG